MNTIKDSDQVAYTTQAIRFTQKGNALYAFLLAWPAEGRVVPVAQGRLPGAGGADPDHPSARNSRRAGLASK
ncbi:MAG: hypothetical protein R2932_37310 [Caldilineaceae bacterium]